MNRHLPYFLLFLLCCTFFSACRMRGGQARVQEPRAIIQKKVFLPNLPSASGVELADSLFYVLSDDSPYLYVLDRQYRLQDSIALFRTQHFTNGRIPPKLKYDPECLALLTEGEEQYLLAMGSGSSAGREHVFRVDLPKTLQNRPAATELNFSTFYSSLKNHEQLGQRETLNLEGLAADREYVYLLPRTLTPPGRVLIFPRDMFLSYLNQRQPEPPVFQLVLVRLPILQNVPSAFSGATIADDHLFFSASVENTTSATLDGDVLGSFIGRVPVRDLLRNVDNATLPAATALIKEANGQPYEGKVESLTVVEKRGRNHYLAVAVVDNDKGQSEVLEVELWF